MSSLRFAKRFSSSSRLVKFLQFSTATSLAGLGGWKLWSRKCFFEPFSPETDALFHSEYYRKFNPDKHPSLDDSCVRKVALSKIQPELVEDALNGGSKLLEKFCGGLWGGYGT